MIPDKPIGPKELRWGRPIEQAAAVIILLHGRGSSAMDMRELARLFDSDRFTFIAPEADGGTWYPYSFLSPIPRNEPYLSQSLGRVEALAAQTRAEGVDSDHTMLLGFSQGACLAIEFAARRLGSCAAVAGLSGGLIGPPGTTWEAPDPASSLKVFLGCGDPDPHIPIGRVEETARFFASAGARVDLRIYPGLGHTVNQDEIEQVRRLMSEIAG